MELFEKVMVGKKTTYRPYAPASNTLLELPQDTIVGILICFNLAFAMSVTGKIPDHSRTAIKLKKLEAALLDLAVLNGKKMDVSLLEASTEAYNAALKSLQVSLSRVPA